MNFIRPLTVFGCVFLLTFVVVSPKAAKAGGKEAPTLDWQTPSQCGTTEDIQNGLTAILGERWVDTSFPNLAGRIVDADGKWQVTIGVPSGNKTYTRSVTVNTCEAALEVSSLLIALVIDPSRVLSSEDPKLKSTLESLEQPTGSSETEGEKTGGPAAREGADAKPPEKVQSPAPSPSRKATPSKTPETDKPRSPRPEIPSRPFAVGLSFAADVGTVSSFAPGIALTGSFRRRVFATELLIRYLPPRDTAVGGADGASWSPQLVGISLGAGTSWTVKRLRLMPLIGFCGEGVFAESKNVTRPSRGAVWTAGAWIGVTLEWMLTGWFGLRLQPTLNYLFTRPQFVIDGIGLVYQPSPVAGVFSVGFIFAL